MKLSLFYFKAALMVSVAGSIKVAAQDVSFTAPRWLTENSPSEALPTFGKSARLDFPPSLRGATAPEYVAVAAHIDEKGEQSYHSLFGTQAPYERVVEDEVHFWKMSPAQQAGKPVRAAVWFAVVFNPKSAGATGPEATPRLLTAVPVYLPELMASAKQPIRIRANLKLDGAGKVLETRPEGELSADDLASFQSDMAGWRFAPARHLGEGIPSDLTLTVICEKPERPDPAKYELPKAISRVAPEYPVSMRRSGFGGRVTYSFVVDVDGTVKNPVVMESDNPGLNQAALEALLRWKFKPGTKDGKPVKTHMAVPIVFQLYGGSDSAFEISRKADQSKLPLELRYDTAAKVRGTVVPVFPYALLKGGVTGSAKLLMRIDDRGRVDETKVEFATKPEFGAATVAAVENFKFDPAVRGANAVASFLRYEQQYNSDTTSDPDISECISLEKHHPEKILTPGHLDRKLRPISRVSPVFPVSLLGKSASGEAMIEVLIDSKGRTRLPRIISATAEPFGYAAVQAVSSWLFEPPLAQGKPTIARVQIPFIFKSTAAKGEEDNLPLP